MLLHSKENNRELILYSRNMNSGQKLLFRGLAETGICPVKVELMEPSLEKLFKGEIKPPPTVETVSTSGHLDLPYLKGGMAYQPLTEIATLSLSGEAAADFGYNAAVSKLTPRLLKCSGYDIENWESDADDFCWDFGNWGCKIGGHPTLRTPDICT